MFIFCTIFGIFLSSGLAKLAPDFIHPCNETRRDCLIAATQNAIPGFIKGLPQFGIPPLDPFDVDELSIPLNNLIIRFKDGKVYGLKSCLIDDVVSKLAERIFIMDFHCNLTVKGHYQAEGKFLSFNIQGDGPAKVQLKNLKMHLDINTKYIKDKHGYNHFAIKDYKYTFEYGDKIKYDIKNILNGNEEISARILQLMNENWKPIAEEFGKPFVEYAMQVAMKYCEKFFSKVPYEELIYVPIPL